MQVVLYEDAGAKWFGPLTLLRPVFDLRCGSLLLREKLEIRRPGWAVSLLPRRELAPLVSELYPGRGIDGLQDSDVLLLSARVIVTDELLAAIEAESGELLLTSGGEPVGALLRGGAAERVRAVGDANGDMAGSNAIGDTITLRCMNADSWVIEATNDCQNSNDSWADSN